MQWKLWTIKVRESWLDKKVNAWNKGQEIQICEIKWMKWKPRKNMDEMKTKKNYGWNEGQETQWMKWSSGNTWSNKKIEISEE
jgi:hypothetical protein